ncbi:terminase large subunit domain-containing protein, partial [Novosphingobium sp. GV061]|uniref:terminase gpP N-terminus-related DNA-binding protein n=1 Tax=Novosphingobium sp. GV061 TaxID=2135691 RepID=UPI000D41B2E9
MHQITPPDADDDTPAISRQVARAQRRQARSLYHRGWQLTQIAAELGVKYGTLAAWKSRDAWDDDAPIAVVEDRLEARLATLLDKDPFTEGDMKRVDFMMRQLERAARIRKFDKTGREGDLNPKIEKRNNEEAKAKRADKRKNFLSREQWQALLDDFHDWCFEYQAEWWEQRHQRVRKIRKSRQIGATVYFSRESVAKVAEGILATLDGEKDAAPRNQIFLSASQRQANKFRREIVKWVRRVTGVELKGNPIMLDLSFPAEMDEDGEPQALPAMDAVGFYPLSTNSATAQGESG